MQHSAKRNLFFPYAPCSINNIPHTVDYIFSFLYGESFLKHTLQYTVGIIVDFA